MNEHDLLIPKTKATKYVLVIPPMLKLYRELNGGKVMN